MSEDAADHLDEGIHRDVSNERYQADPCQSPSASAGALRTLLQRSPEHAWVGSRRLNPHYVSRPTTDAMNEGTMLHAMVLETEPPYMLMNFPDYRTAAAKLARDQALSAGLIPIKLDRFEELMDVAASLRARLRHLPEVWAAIQDALDSRSTEATLVWRERGVLCRCRYDTLPAKHFRATYDLKFTGLSAEPMAFGRKMLADHSVQADLYPRAVRAVRGDSPVFVFIACETEPPYGVSLHALDRDAAEIAREQVDWALDRWARCLRENVWPSYPTPIHYHSPAGWQVREWEDRQSGDAMIQETA